MLTKEFEYHLPEELIAQTPIEPRDSSKLLVIDRSNLKVSGRKFSDIKDYFRPGAVSYTHLTLPTKRIV